MDNKPNPNEILHSENQSKLTAEEIAKAVARHNKHHGGAPQPSAQPAKTKKAKH